MRLLQNLSSISIVSVLFLMQPSCGSDHENTNSSELKSLDDADSLTQQPDGSYLAICKDGTREILTQSQVLANDVCNSATNPHPGDKDVFSKEEVCPGPFLDAATRRSIINIPSETTKQLGEMVLYRRAKVCYLADNKCTAWRKTADFPMLTESRNQLIFRFTRYDSSRTPFKKRSQAYIVLSSDYPRVEWQSFDLSKGYEAEHFGRLQSKFSGGITNSCLWANTKHSLKTSDNQGNRVRIHQEFVVFGHTR